jgi:hypothetical protein
MSLAGPLPGVRIAVAPSPCLANNIQTALLVGLAPLDERWSAMKRKYSLYLATLCCLTILLGTWLFFKRGTSVGRVKSCQITIQTSGNGERQLLVTGRVRIDKMVARPLRATYIDLRPADYRGIGWIEIEYEDGREEGIDLFYPLGHFKRRSSYYITDFREIQKWLDSTQAALP